MFRKLSSCKLFINLKTLVMLQTLMRKVKN